MRRRCDTADEGACVHSRQFVGTELEQWNPSRIVACLDHRQIAARRRSRPNLSQWQHSAIRLAGISGGRMRASAKKSIKSDIYGGGSGIRTRDTVSRIHTFQACAFNHSATPPYQTPCGVEVCRRNISRRRTPLALGRSCSWQDRPCGITKPGQAARLPVKTAGDGRVLMVAGSANVAEIVPPHYLWTSRR